MRQLLLVTALLLAGCGGAPAGNDGAASNGAVNATVPPLPANDLPAATDNTTAAGPADNATAADTRRGPTGLTRPEMIEECTSQAQAMLPGVEPGPLCDCSVDRALAGVQRNQAVRQCAAQLNIRLPMD